MRPLANLLRHGGGKLLIGTASTPTVQFAAGRGIYTFQLTVTDSTGATATDLVMVNYQGF